MKVATLLLKLGSENLNAQVKITHGWSREPTTVKDVHVRKDGTVVIR